MVIFQGWHQNLLSWKDFKESKKNERKLDIIDSKYFDTTHDRE